MRPASREKKGPLSPPDRDALAAAAKAKGNQQMHEQKENQKASEQRKKDAEDQKRRLADEDVQKGHATLMTMSDNSKEIFTLLNLALRKDVRDPTIDLIAHISKCISVLKEVIDISASTGRSTDSTIPDTFYECMCQGLREYCIRALSFNVNYEKDRLTGGTFFDTAHMILDFLPTLPAVASVHDCGKCILHESCIYENRTPQLIEESVKLITRYCPDSIGVPDQKNQLCLHHIAASRCTADITDSIERLAQLYPKAPSTKSIDGLIPLHIAVNRDKEDLNMEIIKSLVKLYPVGASVIDNRGRAPLHYAISRSEPSMDVLKLLLKAHPACARIVDMDGKLPLHILLEQRAPSFESVKLLTDNYPNSLKISPSSSSAHLPLHKILSQYPPPFEVVSHIMETDRSAVAAVESEYGYLPMNMAINLLYIAQHRREDLPSPDEQNIAFVAIPSYPDVTDIQIFETAETNHVEVITFLERLINRMLDINRLSASHRTRIDWLPIHYLLLHKFPASTSLFQAFIQAFPESIKCIACCRHSQQPMTKPLSPTSSLSHFVSTESAAMSQMQLPPLLLSTTKSSLDESTELSVKGDYFMPFTFASERGWAEVFGIFKKITVKQLGEVLKKSLERGVTESATGSPRFVTPLPKLGKKN